MRNFQNRIALKTVQFTVRLGNGHFNTTNVTGSYLVVSGVPGHEAVLVNDTNLTSASSCH